MKDVQHLQDTFASLVQKKVHLEVKFDNALKNSMGFYDLKAILAEIHAVQNEMHKAETPKK